MSQRTEEKVKPNRQERRSYLQKRSRKPDMKKVSYIQKILVNGKQKLIYHFKTIIDFTPNSNQTI